jgi:hypothetical protein
MTSWKGSRRKWSWPNLRYTPGIRLEGLGDATEIPVRIGGVPTEIRTTYLPKSCQALPPEPSSSVINA